MELGDTADEVVRPPFALLALAAAAALGALALAPVAAFSANIAGYLLGSVVCFVLAARYFQVDQRRAAQPVDYRPWGGSRRAFFGVVALGFAAAFWHVWWIATELAVA